MISISDPIYYSSATKKIPDWMCSLDPIRSPRPAPSMHGPGRPQGWEDTWEHMRDLMRAQVDDAIQVQAKIDLAQGEWAPNLVEDVRRVTQEPSLFTLDHTRTNLWGSKAPTMYAVPTGRGMIFMVTPMGLTPAHIRQGALMVYPWGRPDLPGWTTIKGEVEPICPKVARPWTWAAWKAKCLMVLVSNQEPEPAELTIPDYLALQKSGLIKW